MKPEILLLWDIDGTLLTTGGAGERALIESLKKNFGIESDLSDIEVCGRTDRRIAMDALKHYGLAQTPENVARFVDGYLDALGTWLPERSPQGMVLQGVRDILEEVRGNRPHIAQGLLTGNMRHGARLKLEYYGAFHYFEVGAFADDHPDRNELPPHAKKRAEEKYGTPFLPEKVFVIGDTPHDIACGKTIGACTVGVATGRYSAAALRACNPTAVFEDLSDKDAFFRLVEGGKNFSAL